jgi:hypothetical protein
MSVHVNNSIYDTINLAKGDVVFILSEDSSSIVGIPEFGIYDTIEELNSALAVLDPSTNDYRIIYGFITTAEIIPDSLPAGISDVFLLIVDPDDDELATTTSVGKTPNEIANTVEYIVKTGKFEGMSDICIDNIFVVYGHELDIHLSVRGEEIDEEVISSCKSTVHKITVLAIENEDTIKRYRSEGKK